MPQLPWPELAAGRRLQREVSTALARVELVVRTEEGGPTPTLDYELATRPIRVIASCGTDVVAIEQFA